MRLHRGAVSAATATCAGATLFGVTSCVGDDNASPQPGIDASLSDVGQPDTAITTVDSSLDASPPADAGPDVVVDTGADASIPCAPGSITGFVVPPYVHANPQPGIVCDDTNDQDMAALCADAAAFSACAAFPATYDASSYPACGACLVTSETPIDAGPDADAGPGGYGPTVLGAVALPNVGGCIELADRTDAGLSCAMAVQAAVRCAEYSCAPSCPVSDDTSRATYAACLQAAAIGPCVTFAQAASACLAAEADAGGVANQWCLPTDGGLAAQLTEIARFFCSS